MAMPVWTIIDIGDTAEAPTVTSTAPFPRARASARATRARRGSAPGGSAPNPAGGRRAIPPAAPIVVTPHVTLGISACV
jgi:hypothetical protein